jgi:hypothetical protein
VPAGMSHSAGHDRRATGGGLGIDAELGQPRPSSNELVDMRRSRTKDNSASVRAFLDVVEDLGGMERCSARRAQMFFRAGMTSRSLCK